MGRRRAEAQQWSEIERCLLCRSGGPKMTRKVSHIREEIWKGLWTRPCRENKKEISLYAFHKAPKQFMDVWWISWFYNAKSGIVSALEEWKSSRRLNGTHCHIACIDVNIVFTQRIALICYTFTRSSSCVLHGVFIPSLVPRHISRLHRTPKHFDFIF